ncbi:DNAse I-like superfamily protein [Perilla frutescens var. hirtella]|nr:DNAse I-like superfamily protein [Perilla frutescens var. hirtella]KAH6811100.1 DNAse I-like superfamily protein [Perilla frutescens var. frutescens]
MLKVFNKKLRRLCSRLGWPRRRRRSRPKIVVKKLGKSSSGAQADSVSGISSAVIHPSSELGGVKAIRFVTFNAALFSMAPAVAKTDNSSENQLEGERELARKGSKSMNDRPRSILKQSPGSAEEVPSRQQKFAKSRLRVSINLPDNEISLKRSGQYEELTGERKGKNGVDLRLRGGRAVVEVLRELNADVVALQDVKAEEEKNMQPLSDLADALGMKYVFADSWAPEFGNAILSKWPIKRWKAQRIFDDTDFRNVLKATIDVPQVGEINVFCTLLDHLDESWRMKQINAIIQSTSVPHILAGGLNSLDETDYSQERWTDIVKYYEEMGKPTPKVEVMKHLKSQEYTDAKDYAGECESVVMIAKGQSVQGTCKYGTRVDYILSSTNAPYKFVPGSYSVVSSKGTSDHHIVKVDVIKVGSSNSEKGVSRKQRRPTVKFTHSSSPSKAIWKLHS